MNQIKFHRLGNICGLIFISITLIIALIIQLSRHDLPCPLCLLQRLCFVGAGLAMCLNLKDGIKTSHYGIITLASILGLTIALRQISLHLGAGDNGYGQLLLGFHLYIWAAIVFTFMIGMVGVALLFEGGFSVNNQPLNRWQFALMILFLILILANGISTFVECSASICPDNPVQYNMLKAADNAK